MKVKINETGEIKELSIVDGFDIDYIEYFIGHWGALKDGQFEYNENEGMYICSDEIYELWNTVIEKQKKLSKRLAEIEKEYGYEVRTLIEMDCTPECDLENFADQFNENIDKLGRISL